MPILDSAALDSDPKGTALLRDVLGVPKRVPSGRKAMRRAAEAKLSGGRADPVDTSRPEGAMLSSHTV